MTADVIVELVEIAISLAHDQADGTSQGETVVALSLADIVMKAVEAYEDHTGQPLNVNLVPSEQPL